MENKEELFVVYVGMKSMNPNDRESYLQQIRDDFLKFNSGYNFIFIPCIEKNDTEIVCINPIYITNTQLISEHEEKMSELNNKINEVKNKIDKNYE
ncbi:MAG: hypothetical protein ACOC2W_01665 [bacterium]